ncbi:7432_t:CDS:2 [Entrophospora sp. SA101]|nr:7432_t:CDS:2 [Entrophospora sp. SA101]
MDLEIMKYNLQDQYQKKDVRVETKQDLDRQLVKSETCIIKLLEIDLEIPSTNQSERKESEPETYEKIDFIIKKLSADYLGIKEKFTVILQEIENLCAPNPDPKLQIQKEEVGNDVMVFPANCSNCNLQCDTRLHLVNIPHFKDAIIMSTVCDSCVYKSNEVKSGSMISEKGKRIKLKILDLEDMSREILKSETCGLSIPEIELELLSGTLGGRFTTVEGLLRQIYDQLEGTTPFISGDKVKDESKKSFGTFINELKKVINCEVLPVTLYSSEKDWNTGTMEHIIPDSEFHCITTSMGTTLVNQ